LFNWGRGRWVDGDVERGVSGDEAGLEVGILIIIEWLGQLRIGQQRIVTNATSG